MFNQQILKDIFEKGFNLNFESNKKENKSQLKRYNKIKDFLLKPNFNGFTGEDLFIMQFIKKGWGHDIAALSNMAEAIANLAIGNPRNIQEHQLLLEEIVFRAIHPKVNPYHKNIESVNNLGKFGYYLEHLNICLGAYARIVDNEKYHQLNKRVSFHLLKNSMSYSNYHADLLPHVKMKWPADQSAILYSLWLYDQNNGTDISSDLIQKWLNYMDNNEIHQKTGLFKTEVLKTRNYSNQPRGCSISYLCHYMGKFAPEKAKHQWELYKQYMMTKIMGKTGFREYLPEYDGKWSPDSGPIIADVGIAATGFALNASSTVGDIKTFRALEKSMNPIYSVVSQGDKIPMLNMLTKLGTDLLSSAIWLNAETKQNWYG